MVCRAEKGAVVWQLVGYDCFERKILTHNWQNCTEL